MFHIRTVCATALSCTLVVVAHLLLLTNIHNADAQVIEINSTDCSQWAFWARWTQISACSVSCGSGTQTRRRQRGCQVVEGVTQVDLQTFACQTDPVDGGVSEWSEWTEDKKCPAYCGKGLRRKVRRRTCDNPAPSCNGARCTEDLQDVKFAPCINFPCGNICPNPLLISQFTPYQGFYIECLKGSGFLKKCPPFDPKYASQSKMFFNIQEVYRVCYGRYGAFGYGW